MFYEKKEKVFTYWHITTAIFVIVVISDNVYP